MILRALAANLRRMGFIQEFKEFAMKGNVVDLAVGVVIGGAFGKIVTSFVEDLINPLLGLLQGKQPLQDLYIPLAGQTAAKLADAKAGGAVIAYGNLLNNVIQFVIVAFAIFIVIKIMNRLVPMKGANLLK